MQSMAKLFGNVLLWLLAASLSLTSCEILDDILQGIEDSNGSSTDAELIMSSQEIFDVDPEGDVLFVQFSSTLSWELSLSDSGWITVDKTSGDSGDVSVRVKVQCNDSGEARSSVMSIVSEDERLTVTFNQESCQELPSFKILSENATISAEGGIVEIELIAGIEYYMTIINDWVREIEKTGSERVTHVLQVDPNPEYEQRIATVSFCTDQSCIPYTIMQEGAEMKIGDTGSTEDIIQGDDIEM